MSRRWIFLFAVALCAGLHLPAAADGGIRGWGPRVGITSSPDQVYFGAHLDCGDFADRVRFQPNLEIGVGDGVTLAALNAEAAYRFRSDWGHWSPYVGGGVGLNITGNNEGLIHNSDTQLGASALAGIEKGLGSGQRVFLEAKLGLVESPDLKLAIGWTFFH